MYIRFRCLDSYYAMDNFLKQVPTIETDKFFGSKLQIQLCSDKKNLSPPSNRTSDTN
jgi:hypothetical protein